MGVPRPNMGSTTCSNLRSPKTCEPVGQRGNKAVKRVDVERKLCLAVHAHNGGMRFGGRHF